MSTVKGGRYLVGAAQWWRHLKDWKREFWHRERKAEIVDIEIRVHEVDVGTIDFDEEDLSDRPNVKLEAGHGHAMATVHGLVVVQVHLPSMRTDWPALRASLLDSVGSHFDRALAEQRKPPL